MPVVNFAPFDKFPEVKGVFVGGCVDRGAGSSFRARAHAHTDGDNQGWICVRSHKRLYTPSGAASHLMLHELAHILTLEGHTKNWAYKLRELGGSITWYKKYQGVKSGLAAYERDKRKATTPAGAVAN